MNINTLLQKLARKHNPNRLQRDRMKEKIFTELNIEASVEKHTNIFDLIIMNKKLLLGTATFAVIGIFVGLPLLLSTQEPENGISSLSNNKTRTVTDELCQMETVNSVGGMPAPESIAMKPADYISESPSIMPKTEIYEEDTSTEEDDRAKQKTGILSLLVGNVSSGIDEIYELVSSVEGYVVDSYFSSKTNSGTGMITIRVPSDKFDFTMKSLRDLAIEVTSENTNILDLQNEVSNNETQLTTLREELAEKYAELENATVTEKSVLERQIKQIENQISILEEQGKQLAQESTYSTISIDLYQKVGEENPEDLMEILTAAWEKTQTILLFWAKTGVWATLILPAAGLPIILFVLARKIMKRLRKE